ncbi:aldehyde dehydrogenase family protein [Teladorsagia circumcincta]|uniref:Aldehyde dehydrogenase family protein n=1 Tax=Teladorsagia circumcincta TaxID=45464 RepID=A0A2G9USN7_TELCI|nr:aldehyde dehydrogenase family protein [Teladorsagia circumcincta]
MLKDVVDRLVNSPNNNHEPLSNFIDNEFVCSKNLMPSVNPATGQEWIQIPDSTADDVHQAVAAANRAFPSWSTTSVQYRSGLLLKLADIIEENFDGLAILESRDQGKPIKLAKCNFLNPSLPDSRQNLPDVDEIEQIYTTGTVVGKKIAETCGRLNKKVSLEMGGKMLAIVYPSCDLNQHLPTIARSCFINQGEICLCSSRIFVHKAIYRSFVELLVQEAKKFTVGDPSKEVTLGAMNSEAHFNKVKSYISLSEKEGGTVQCGGEIKLDGSLKNGYYIAPTVITDLGDSSRCMQEEIFGPVVCVTEFESTEEVVSRANATPYGLSATVWSENNKELINTAHALRVGTTRDLNMPFGGTKESGMGREGAVDSLHFFTEQKTVCIRI